jgi:hypothetical protein
MSAAIPMPAPDAIRTNGAAFRAAAIAAIRALGTPTTRQLVDALGATDSKERNLYRTRLAAMERKGLVCAHLGETPDWGQPPTVWGLPGGEGTP